MLSYRGREEEWADGGGSLLLHQECNIGRRWTSKEASWNGQWQRVHSKWQKWVPRKKSQNCGNGHMLRGVGDEARTGRNVFSLFLAPRSLITVVPRPSGNRVCDPLPKINNRKTNTEQNKHKWISKWPLNWWAHCNPICLCYMCLLDVPSFSSCSIRLPLIIRSSFWHGSYVGYSGQYPRSFHVGFIQQFSIERRSSLRDHIPLHFWLDFFFFFLNKSVDRCFCLALLLSTNAREELKHFWKVYRSWAATGI